MHSMFRVAVVAALIAFAGAANAQDDASPRGPAMGDNAYVTEIRSVDGTPDADDYVASLRAGETLSVVVQATRHSKLRPHIEVLQPDGTEAAVAARSSKSGRMVNVRGFHAAQTGRHTVRITGSAGSEGGYAVAFSIRPLPPIVLRHQQLGNVDPLFREHAFPAVDGALLDLRIGWNRHSVPLELRSLVDPSGAEVTQVGGAPAIELAKTRGDKLSLLGVPLHTGDGDYRFRVRIPQGAATYSVSIGVVPQGRPRAKKPVALDPAELQLDAQVLRGRPGFTLHLTGRGFSTAGAPRVFVGAKPAQLVGAVAADGKSLDVVVPAGVPGTFVTLAVQNPDGQSVVRPGAFEFLQPIQVTDLVDDAGEPVRRGSAKGGLTLHLKGDFFETGQTVTFGTTAARVLSVVSPQEMLIVTPKAPAGFSKVIVHDLFGGVATSTFDFFSKQPPTFDAKPYTPSVAAVETAVSVRLTGKDFEAVDQLAFDGQPIESVFVDGKTRTFSVPALPAGSYSVTLTDSIGTVETGPDFVVKPPPQIASVSIVAGPHVGSIGAPVGGGCTVQVDGAYFHYTDHVTLAGADVELASSSATRFTFVAPPGTLGNADLAITDGANQAASLAAAIRYVGYEDATVVRAPGATPADSLAADRGAVGDLDGDGARDDLVLVSNYGYVGTRPEMTRVFFGDASGHLADVTPTNFPTAGSDTSGTDTWSASAVALGDIDGAGGTDIVISGYAPFSYYGVYGSVRMFTNDGAGNFTLDESIAPPADYASAVFASDPVGTYFLVYGTVFEQGTASALALGDLDRDGDLDLVVGRDHYDYRYVGIAPSQVNFANNPPTISTSNPAYLSYFQYHSATKVYANRIATGNGFVDTTATAIPAVGDSNSAPVPCFQAKDLALGDLDRDGDLDVVLTWDDPTTVSALGTYQGSGIDTPRVATRVLLNDGTGRFTDATSSWIPAGTSPEFWQATRLALVDLDKDGDLDLVLVHAQGTDAFLGTPTFAKTALRVLRNNGPASGFADATASAMPALTGDGDNDRGSALTVCDVDGDGWLDLVVGTTEALSDASGNPLPRTRLFRGGPGLVFTRDTAFLPGVARDTGEAGDVLAIGDLSGAPDPSLILVCPVTPATSVNGELLRILDWKR
jgi:VCBS repeat protein/IPT/TIG domain-containing protein/FG-GAP repeat protein